MVTEGYFFLNIDICRLPPAVFWAVLVLPLSSSRESLAGDFVCSNEDLSLVGRKDEAVNSVFVVSGGFE